jgi:hypothetical protein
VEITPGVGKCLLGEVLRAAQQMNQPDHRKFPAHALVFVVIISEKGSVKS